MIMLNWCIVLPPFYNEGNWILGYNVNSGMVDWHHQLDGHEFEQALGVGDG